MLQEMAVLDVAPRFVILEDTPEICCQAANVMQAKTTHTVTLRDLARASMRLSPSRLIVGEVRGGEAAELLKLLNTGHQGSCFTLHASSACDALQRLDDLAQESGLPPQPEQISRAIDLVLFLTETPRRHLQEVLRVEGYEPTRGYLTQPITHA